MQQTRPYTTLGEKIVVIIAVIIFVLMLTALVYIFLHFGPLIEGFRSGA